MKRSDDPLNKIKSAKVLYECLHCAQRFEYLSDALHHEGSGKCCIIQVVDR